MVIIVCEDERLYQQSIQEHIDRWAQASGHEGIQTRMLFAGNLLKHPCFDEMRQTGEGYRVVGELTNTDVIMNRTFWIGVYPGMNDAMIEYMIGKIREFVRK